MISLRMILFRSHCAVPHYLLSEVAPTDHAMRARDIGRLIMWHFGGVFVDAGSLLCIRSLEPLLRGLGAFVAFENDRVVSDRIFGAVSHHPLFRGDSDLPAPAGSDAAFRSALAAQMESAASLSLPFRAFAPHLFFFGEENSSLSFTIQRRVPSFVGTLISRCLILLNEFFSFGRLDQQQPPHSRQFYRRAKRPGVTESTTISISKTASPSAQVLYVF